MRCSENSLVNLVSKIILNSRPLVEFLWKAPSAGALGYEGQWSLSPWFVAASSASTPSVQYAVELPADGRWFFRVRRLDVEQGRGPWSLSGRVLLDRQAPTPPSVPTAIPTRGTNQVSWSWVDSFDVGGVSHYGVCYGDDPGVNLRIQTYLCALLQEKRLPRRICRQ